MYFRSAAPSGQVGPVGSLSYPPDLRARDAQRWQFGNQPWQFRGGPPCLSCTGLGAPGALSGGLGAAPVGLALLGGILGYLRPWGGMKKETSAAISAGIGLGLGLVL